MAVCISESRFPSGDDVLPHRKPNRANVIASIALACVIGIALAGCFFIGLSGGFRP